MTEFKRDSFFEFILGNNVVGFFKEPIILKSGRKSHWYVNWRNVASDIFLTNKLSDFVIDFISDLKIHHDGFFGVPEGATKLAVISSYKWAREQPNYDIGSHALSMGRGKPKEHGAAKDKFFVGEPRGKIIVLEDVTTTGSSLIETIKKVKEVGAQVITAVGLTDRMELTDDKKTVTQIVAEHGVEFHAMSKATEILPLACKKLRPEAHIIKSIEDEFKEHGFKQISLE